MTIEQKSDPSDIFNQLSAALKESLEKNGITSPTEIQSLSMEPILQGRDIIGQSMTGSGKTLAFSLPLALRLSESSSQQKNPQIIILTPTRELAQQIHKVFRTILHPLKIKCTEVIGGASYQNQISAIKRGAQVIIGTPGRIADLMKQKAFTPEYLSTFVLDEVDQMLDFGFADDLNTIREYLPKEIQTVFFSATLNPEIERLARSLLKDPVKVKAGQTGSPQLIEHGYYFIQSGKKLACLVNLLFYENPDQAIIFCETKKDCGEVAAALVARGLNASQINSDLSQSERQKTMSRFRQGSVSYLVATNVAARGIDIQDLPTVIHYSIPRDRDSYTHRSGRTGRAGSTGISLSLVTPPETRAFVDLMSALKIKPKPLTLPDATKILNSITNREIASLTDLNLADDQKSKVHESIDKILDQIPAESAKTLLAALLYSKFKNLDIAPSSDVMCDRPLNFQRSHFRANQARSHRNYSNRGYRDSRVRSYRKSPNSKTLKS